MSAAAKAELESIVGTHCFASSFLMLTGPSSAWCCPQANGDAVKSRLSTVETAAVSTRVQSMLNGLDAATRDAVLAKLKA